MKLLTQVRHSEILNCSDFLHWSLSFFSLGTFVFTFVAQHAVHLVFESLDPRFRNMENFQKTTSLATLMSTVISFGLGLVVYMTYWEHTSSAMFNLYPPSAAVDICRILLCISMLLTYPFPFLTVRELLILLVFSKDASVESETASMTPTEPLVGLKLKDVRESWLQPGQERQLKPKQHFVLTILLWSITLILALAASSLGDVLNLTGCATGTGE